MSIEQMTSKQNPVVTAEEWRKWAMVDFSRPVKMACAVTTYVPENAGPGCIKRLQAFLHFYETSGFPGELYIIDDGSTNAEFRQYLLYLSHRYFVKFKAQNHGIAAAKNSCIVEFMNNDIEYGFICDDDINLLDRWWKPYLGVMCTTRVHHLSWAWDRVPWPYDFSSAQTYTKENFIHNDSSLASPSVRTFTRLVKTNYVNGCFLTWSRLMGEKLGGFKILPCKWGHEHTNYSLRAIMAGFAPCFCDVEYSNHHILMGRYADCSTITVEDKNTMAVLNEPEALDTSVLYQPLREFV